MLEFIEKYRDFKIFDEKSRVYPLHIDRAMYFDVAHQKPAEKDGAHIKEV